MRNKWAIRKECLASGNRFEFDRQRELRRQKGTFRKISRRRRRLCGFHEGHLNDTIHDGRRQSTTELSRIFSH